MGEVPGVYAYRKTPYLSYLVFKERALPRNADPQKKNAARYSLKDCLNLQKSAGLENDVLLFRFKRLFCSHELLDLVIRDLRI
jgi:hypothetical protein